MPVGSAPVVVNFTVSSAMRPCEVLETTQGFAIVIVAVPIVLVGSTVNFDIPFTVVDASG